MKKNNITYLTFFVILSFLIHAVIITSFNFKTVRIKQNELTVDIISIEKKIDTSEAIIPETKDQIREVRVAKAIEKKIKAKVTPEKKLTTETKEKELPPSLKDEPKRIIVDQEFIQSQISKQLNEKQKKNRSKLITNKTTERDYASYYQVWKSKVEKIGALNYPKAARNGLSESLIMTVTLSQDGNIIDISINKTSGVKDLDEAAINIVKLGAPYASFPEKIKDEVDTLEIRRVWRFTNNLGQ
jgi:protein TonB